MAANVRIVDRGWKKIKTDVEQLRGRGVKVGLMAGGPVQDSVAVVDYAVYSEFGTSRIPSRPFMRKTADDAERPLGAFAQGLARNVLRGSMTANQVLDGLGLWYQARVRSTIRSASSWAVPNAPSTIAMKGSSKPLIDHAVMIGAINYEKTRM